MGVFLAAVLMLLTVGGWAQEGSGGAFSLARCTPLPVETQMHGCAVVGQRLYAFGGESRDGYSNQVYSCEILDSGELGSWKEETPLPDRRHYIGSSVQVVNDRIYVAGGQIADAPRIQESMVRNADTVLWTVVRSDGSLAPWKVSSPFPGPARANLSTCSSEKHLYLLGGNSSRTISDAVLMADFAPDGTPENWRSAATLPVSLWYQGSAILENRMYVWGGLETLRARPANARVFSAELKEDGTLSEWRQETPMPEAVYSSAFCGFNDYLLAIGGRVEGGTPSNKIWFSRLEGGRVGEWRSLESNLEARVFHALGLDRSRGRLYITGGKFRAPTVTVGGTVLAAVQAFQLGDREEKTAGAVAQARRATADSVKESLKAGGKVLLYFRSPEVPAVRRFEEGIVSSPDFARLTAGYELQTVDSSKDRVLCYEYGVFQVPSLVVATPDGGKRRSGMLQNLEDVRTFLAGDAGRANNR